MTTDCRCFRFWLDDDEIRPPDLIDPAERARHLAECPGCREDQTSMDAQRADVRNAYGPGGVPPPLTEALVRRYLGAMARAAEDPPPNAVEGE